MDNVCQGFDQTVLRQIKDCINLPQQTKEPVQQELSPEGTLLRFGEDMPSGNGQKKTPLENWQKYMENGEYLRSSEIDEEQNYNMIDGRRNNMPPKGKDGRASVLTKLHRKQAEIAKRSGRSAPQMAMAEDMERRRK